MRILVFNCGSSSLNYKLYDADGPDSLRVVVAGKAHRVGVQGSEPSFIEHRWDGQVEREVVPIANHRQAAKLALAYLQQHNLGADCVGHRFVHGGSYFRSSTFLTPEVLEQLERCRPLAPIHNPNSLSVTYECKETLPGVPQYAVFDTAFHGTIPDYAYTYALPARIVTQYGLRKYGFHGLSYGYLSREMPRFLGRPVEGLRIVACHLGTGGSSVAAIRDGKSVDCSMGHSPLPGLVMSTRCGDIDPMVPLYLTQNAGYSAAQLTRTFNKQSGLLALSGFSSDIRDIIRKAAETGDEPARLAVEIYAYRIKKYVGSYVTALGGMDVLVFTDDIGVQSWQVREKACDGLAWAGVALDLERNRSVPFNQTSLVSAAHSRVSVVVIPADEELAIAGEGQKLWRER